MLITHPDYEGIERKQVARRILWVTIGACLVLGLLNVNLKSWPSVLAISAATLVCVIALLAFNKGYETLASILVCSSVLLAITYSIADGDGLLDPGILGYPLFILLGTLLLGKRYTLWLTFTSILCLCLVGFLQKQGALHLTLKPYDASNLIPIIIFLVAGAAGMFVILENLESNYARIHNSENELRKSYDLTIEGLSKALDERDGSTGEHSLRVVKLAEKLARATPYPEDNLLSLRYGAYLHDIGKIGIPDSILNNSGPLSPKEMDIMRTHTLRAGEILAHIPYLQPALAIPKYHHEHWDGNGYPEHLKGEAIPLAARIFAVVDVWDALTHDRPYRQAWSQGQAIAYITEKAGSQFDPAIVKAFLRIIGE